jgi:hypothetical protein
VTQQHTPGPWRLSEDEERIRALDCPADGGDIICEYPDAEMSNARWPANARLIAASPEIKDALEEAYRFITQPLRMDTSASGAKTATYRIDGYNALTSKLRAALAKAGAA